MNVRNSLSLIDRASNAATVAAALGPWQQTNRKAVVIPKINYFINTVRATPGTVMVGALGFSLGARYALLQAKGPTVNGTGQGGGVDAVVGFYPSFVSVTADFNGLTCPVSLGIAEEDGVETPQSLNDVIAALEQHTGLPHEVRRYKGQVHGFAVRSDWSSDQDKQAMDAAVEQGVEWFNEHLS